MAPAMLRVESSRPPGVSSSINSARAPGQLVRAHRLNGVGENQLVYNRLLGDRLLGGSRLSICRPQANQQSRYNGPESYSPSIEALSHDLPLSSLYLGRIDI